MEPVTRRRRGSESQLTAARSLARSSNLNVGRGGDGDAAMAPKLLNETTPPLRCVALLCRSLARPLFSLSSLVLLGHN